MVRQLPGACVPGAALACSDGNPCTDDKCDSKKGCLFTHNVAPCSDGNGCTSGDACLNGACLPGAATSCDDANLCTTDSCDPKLGCVFADNNVACNDGNACTVSDTCSGGSCIGQGMNCDDGIACTKDVCDPASGGCSHSPD